MKKLDQFIIKSFLGPFFGILMVVVFILMLQFLWLYIDELEVKAWDSGLYLSSSDGEAPLCCRFHFRLPHFSLQ